MSGPSTSTVNVMDFFLIQLLLRKTINFVRDEKRNIISAVAERMYKFAIANIFTTKLDLQSEGI